MPIAKIQMPDGRIAKFEVPEGTTPEQVMEFASGMEQPANATANKSWGDVGISAVQNFPRSLGNIVSSIAGAVRHPIDTAGNVLDVAAGGLQNILPESLVSAVNKNDPNAQRAAEARMKADAVGQHFKQRYGSMEGFKGALAEDPAGVMADAATVATMGGGLLSKVPGMNTAGQMAIKAGKAIDPLSMTVKAGVAGTKALGSGSANILGGLGTHTGAESIKAAARAGFEGGGKQKAFIEGMRGKADITDVLDDAKAALGNMRTERGAAYRQGMGAVSKDQTILDMKPIIDSVDAMKKIGTYKGKVIDPSTASVRSKIETLVNDWASSNPADFHTPEGLDALKRAVGDIRDSTDFGTPARKVADSIYHSVKGQVTKQAPEYAKVMKGYEESSQLLKEIEKSLSLGNKASADTAIRKLQSLTRNNVNTNYGGRLSLAKELEGHGASNLMASLSGQALNKWTPRGLGSATAIGSGGLGYLIGGPAVAAPLMASQSPRLVGEAALKAGQGARGIAGGANLTADALRKLGLDPAIVANYLYQSNNGLLGE